MKTIMKFFSIITAFALLIGVSAPAYAEVNNTSIVNSGDNATVNTSATDMTNVNVTNVNTATVSQVVSANSNTGYNSANGNIGDGTGIMTGGAGVQVGLDVMANKNMTAISVPYGPSANMTDVVNTGDDANVHTSIFNSTNENVNNVNTAVVSQTVSGNANTGFNGADGNIGGAHIMTGGAGVGVGLDTMVNKNTTAIGSWGSPLNGWSLGNSLTLTNTGDNADVNTSATSMTNATVNSVNTAVLSQMTSANSNSGYNGANGNIGAGTGIMTGGAGVGVGFDATANSNMVLLGLLSGMPSLNGVDIVNTGDNLSSTTSVFNSLNMTALNSNTWVANQTTSDNSNTGYNGTDGNIGGAHIMSGGAMAGISFDGAGNANMTALGGSLAGALVTLLSML